MITLAIFQYICGLTANRPPANCELNKMGSTGIDRMEISR